MRVELWQDLNGDSGDGAEFFVGWTYTDTNGFYYFSGEAPGVYQVQIPESNFVDGLPLAGSGYSSPISSILDDQIDGDDSGRQPDGPKTAVYSPLITLTPGTEPLGNGTSAAEHARGGELDNYTVDANGDMTIDFGFVEPGIMGIGNLVFVDANGNNRFDVGEDQVGLALNGTYMADYRQQVTPTSQVRERVGIAGSPVKLRARATVDWTRERVTLGAAFNYVDRYRDVLGTRIAAQPTLDLQARLAAPERGIAQGVAVTLNVRNVFDRGPPFYDNPVGIGYDPTNADPVGRFVALQFTRAW